MALFGSQGERFAIPSVARTVFDVSGAGDTVIAVLSLALAAGAPIEQRHAISKFRGRCGSGKTRYRDRKSRDEILALIEHGGAELFGALLDVGCGERVA